MKQQLPLLIVLSLLFAAAVPGARVEKGGDLSLPVESVSTSHGATEPAQDVPVEPTPDSAIETTLPSSQVAESLDICRCGGDPRKKECTCRVGCRCTGYVSLRDAIRAYRESGGQPAYVRGKTDAQHLVDDHGWSVDQVSGLTIDEQRYLHGASHAGAIDATNYVAARVAPFSRGESANQPPGAESKPALTIRVAPFYCPPCETMRGYDWSGFDVTWETGGDVQRGYPEASWTDSRGTLRWLAGAHTPSQVKWSMDRTNE